MSLECVHGLRQYNWDDYPIYGHIQKRIRDAIEFIRESGRYPSAGRIAEVLGRSSGRLNNKELKIRDKIFKEFGIRKMRTDWNETPRSDWWNT